MLSFDGKVRTFIFHQPAKKPDLTKIVPMRLPVNPRPLPSLVDMTIEAAKAPSPGPAKVFAGSRGEGRPGGLAFASPALRRVADAAPDDGVGSQEYGTSGQPYTMARAPRVLSAPYREAGLLIHDDGGGTLVSCSAALVKPGIVVTAAHCLVPFGTTNYYASVIYLPAWDTNGASSYGYWNAASVAVLSAWTRGNDGCTTAGVVCGDDVGVITLQPQQNSGGTNYYVGKLTGYFGYAQNNYNYSNGQAEITQLGYSAGFDGGNVMLRTDSQGSVSASNAQNTIIGSPLGNGSDGGPFVVNLGPRPVATSGWSYGTAYVHDVIVGVTSWYTGTSTGTKQAGASPFLARNIGTLVTNACNATPAAC